MAPELTPQPAPQPDLSAADGGGAGDDDPLSCDPACDPACNPDRGRDCTRGGLTVRLILDAPDTRPPLAGWLPARVVEAMAAAGVTRGTLDLRVLDDAAMGAMHRAFQGDPTPTDVLTFDLRDAADAELEGDVALCVDEAARRAAERGHPVRDEILLYAVHGLLHLLGEDDRTPADYARMHAREDDLLTAIGVGPRFAAAPLHPTPGAGTPGGDA